MAQNYIPGGFYPIDVTNPGAILQPTTVVKVGSGAGDYSTNSASYVDVDTTNLQYVTYIPTGEKMFVTVLGSMYNDLAGGANSTLALFDSVPNTQVQTRQVNNNGNTVGVAYAVSFGAVIVGDNNVHTLKLQFRQVGGGTAHLTNGSGNVAQMIIYFGIST